MKKIKFIIVIFTLVLIISSNFAFAKYVDVVYGNATATLKRSIFIVNTQEEITREISSISNNYYESEFNILNYIRRRNNRNRV